MSHLTDGLLLHDVVLIILGSLLFIVMLAGFIVRISRNEEVSQLSYIGFLIPVLMIAFPSIQRLSFSKDVVELEKAIQKSVEEPENVALAEQIERKAADIKNRASSKESVTAVAKGLVNSPEKAVEFLENNWKLVEKSPELQEVAEVVQTKKAVEEAVKSENPEKIQEVTNKVEERKKDSERKGYNWSKTQYEQLEKVHDLSKFAPSVPQGMREVSH